MFQLWAVMDKPGSFYKMSGLLQLNARVAIVPYIHSLFRLFALCCHLFIGLYLLASLPTAPVATSV